MPPENPSQEPFSSGSPVPLSVSGRRVLGVLVEKAKTTPDAYPLSLNALATGCNQKSNRDPLLNLTEADVEETLLDLQKMGLVTRITGGRVERWRHNLYEAWRVNKVELAVLAELLLRGPQTEGELRGRASRMELIDDLETLRNVLRPLAERNLAVFLGPEGRRGTLITHGFHDRGELEQLRLTRAAGAERGAESGPLSSGPDFRPTPSRPSESANLASLEAQLNQTRAEVSSLQEVVAQMQAALTRLDGEVRSLRDNLGG